MRRTVNLPDALDERVREASSEQESYSAAVTRLLEAGLRAGHGEHRPKWIGSGEGPEDLARRAEKYLSETVRSE